MGMTSGAARHKPLCSISPFRVLSGWRIRSGVGKGLWWLRLALGAQGLAASPTGEVELGSAGQGIPGPQRVEAPRGERSARADCAPSPRPPLPFPPPPRLLCVAVKRLSINPVWSGARAQGLFVQWLEVQKSALSCG